MWALQDYILRGEDKNPEHFALAINTRNGIKKVNLDSLVSEYGQSADGPVQFYIISDKRKVVEVKQHDRPDILNLAPEGRIGS